MAIPLLESGELPWNLTHHVKTFETLGECEACRDAIVYSRSDDCVIAV
jgi:hypothetical protein